MNKPDFKFINRKSKMNKPNFKGLRTLTVSADLSVVNMDKLFISFSLTNFNNKIHSIKIISNLSLCGSPRLLRVTLRNN